jgi:hypothetical protein
MSQIQTVKYSSELQKQLFPNNEFYKNSLSETGIAADAATFEIPNLSDIDGASLGTPTKLPLSVSVSDDTKVTGTMKQLYCKPIVIQNEEEFTTNYNKRMNKQLQQAAAINTKAADYAVYQWLPTANGDIVVSTGTARATSVTGLTGNRKALTKADLLNVKKKLMLANTLSVPGGLFALLTPDAYNDLLAIAEFVDYDKLGNTSKLEQGVLGRILGFDIMVRSKDGHIGALYTASNAKLWAATTAATDRPVNLFWHSGMVCHAEANAMTYVNDNDATYLGTVLNSSTRFGAEKCREDEKGVVALPEVA